MYCPYCGVELQDDSIFCHSCGKRFMSASVGIEEEIHNPKLQKEFEREIEANSSTIVATQVTEDVVKLELKQKKKSKVRLIICSTLVLALIVVVAFTLFTGNAKKYSDSVLYLELYDDHRNIIGSASGFIIQDGTTMVTNYHVIDGTYHIEAYTSDGEKHTSADTILAYDEKLDLAVLQCNDNLNVNPIPIGNFGTVEQGDKVYAIGYPLGLANTFSEGVISSLYQDNGVDMIQTTAAISSGSSGGVLMDKRGRAIGVTAASYEDGQSLNLAIPIAYVAKLLENKNNETTLAGIYKPQYPVFTVKEVIENYSELNSSRFYIEGYTPTSVFYARRSAATHTFILFNSLSDMDQEINFVTIRPTDSMKFAPGSTISHWKVLCEGITVSEDNTLTIDGISRIPME